MKNVKKPEIKRMIPDAISKLTSRCYCYRQKPGKKPKANPATQYLLDLKVNLISRISTRTNLTQGKSITSQVKIRQAKSKRKEVEV